MDALAAYDSDRASDSGSSSSGSESVCDKVTEGRTAKRQCLGAPSSSVDTAHLQEPGDATALPAPPIDDFSAEHRRVDTHQGRTRQIAHLDGHFAVHVFLRVAPDPALQSPLSKCVEELKKKAKSTVVQAINPEDYHISLSRTLMLPLGQIDGFADALRVAFRSALAIHAQVSDSPCELANDDRTCFFAALELRRNDGHAAVSRLVDVVDDVVCRYDHSPFYCERRLHFSIAWSLQRLPSLPALATNSSVLHFREVVCRIGERYITFPLRLPR